MPELVRRETGRSCAPLGLYDESLRVAVVLGGRLAVGLDPLGGAGFGAGGAGPTAAHRAVNSRWQREASVLRARRMTVSPGPAPDPDGGVLDALAQDLRTPWAAYMRRLWVRLHGGTSGMLTGRRQTHVPRLHPGRPRRRRSRADLARPQRTGPSGRGDPRSGARAAVAVGRVPLGNTILGVTCKVFLPSGVRTASGTIVGAD